MRDVLIHDDLSEIIKLLINDLFQSTMKTIQFVLIPVVYITQHCYNDNNNYVDHHSDHHINHHVNDHIDHNRGDDNHELTTVLAITTIAYDIHMIETEKWIYSNHR